jgi:hypothetical protein
METNGPDVPSPEDENGELNQDPKYPGDRDASGMRRCLVGWSSPQIEKLGRLHWRAHTSLAVFGVRIGIRANLPELLDPLMQHVLVGWRPIHSDEVDRIYSVIGGSGAGLPKRKPRLNLLFGDAQQLVSTTQSDDLQDAFESDIGSYVGRTARTRVFVHAGVVGWNEFAIVIPGRSHSGKTTLVQALLKEGATYYSDEFAIFDQRGRVHPYPRRLSVRTNAASDRIAAEQLGAQMGNTPLQVGLVILTRYRRGAHWQPNSLSVGRGVLGLLQNTLAARKYPELAFQALGKAVQSAHVFGGERGEAEETARYILQHIGC